jgi:alpha-D-ribose 1-methylphosphonate 5-triphosphate synthase subunit PhnH
MIDVDGLPSNWVVAWQGQASEYPLGADRILVDQSGKLCGLPRSTKIFMEE